MVFVTFKVLEIMQIDWPLCLKVVKDCHLPVVPDEMVYVFFIKMGVALIFCYLTAACEAHSTEGSPVLC